MPQDYTTLVQEAQKVLEFNWTGEYTRPQAVSAPVVLGLGLYGDRLRPLGPAPSHQGVNPSVRQPVEKRPLAPDRLRPALRRVFSWG